MSQPLPSNLDFENRRKSLGAFYTDGDIAQFLVRWAIRDAHDKVLDPSFGGAVFLKAAAERIIQRGGVPAKQIFGIEIDRAVHAGAAEALREEFNIRSVNLVCSDFFGVHAAFFPKMSAIVGNPPFIRFHRFAGASRERAQRRLTETGITLSELSSSWAAFVVHSTAFLRKHGRLAMVVPYEMCHATYAQAVLRHLNSCFAELTILTFEEKLFPNLNENTALLLADDYDSGQKGKFYWRDLRNAAALTDYALSDADESERTVIGDAEKVSGGGRFSENLISPAARAIYKELIHKERVRRFHEIADVGIGYVTGANDYFHLSAEDVVRRDIPASVLKKAVRRGRSLAHLTFKECDWKSGLQTGESGWLLSISSASQITGSVAAYLQEGIHSGVAERYKCRNRRPWYSVPHVYEPDAFLSYMSGRRARLSANCAQAVAPNSLHMVRLHMTTSLNATAVASLWQTSLTRLSTEIEGHALGGGMLKLEPREAESVVLAWPDLSLSRIEEIGEELDALSRKSEIEQVQRRADEIFLKRELGLSTVECAELSKAAEALTLRRMSKK